MIVPTWNRAHCLSEALQSVSQQTYRDVELIVVDDGSTDETPWLLERDFAHVRRHRLSATQGVSAARNWGISHSDSAWVAFLDSDDVWLPHKLERQMAVVAQRAEAVHFTDEIWIRNGRRVNPAKRHRKREGWIFIPSLELCLMAPSTILLRRDVFEVCGLFDESLEVCEDYDLWLRIASRFRVKHLPEALMLRHGGHPDQLSARHWGNDRFRVQSLQKIAATVPLNQLEQAALQRVYRRKCEILEQGFRKRGKQAEADQYAKWRASELFG